MGRQGGLAGYNRLFWLVALTQTHSIAPHDLGEENHMFGVGDDQYVLTNVPKVIQLEPHQIVRYRTVNIANFGHFFNFIAFYLYETNFFLHTLLNIKVVRGLVLGV